MKIYFIASPRSANKEPELYKRLFDVLANDNKMVNSQVLDWTKGELSKFYEGTHEQRVAHYKKTMNSIKSADVVAVEVSEHSMSMGYIVNKALEENIPVLALYKKGNEPYFFSGIDNPKLQVVEYDDNNLEDNLQEALENAKDLADVRFNFFVSPKILAYLDFVAKKRMIPRSVFLRDLIEHEMKKDKDFKGKRIEN